MKVFTQIQEIRTQRWQEPLLSWGLVPTMGYLHQGHLSLVQRARAENDRVGVSIFVNPTQFNDAKDLEGYPRNLERDLELLEIEGVDLVWTPTSEIVYPPLFQTYVEVEQITRVLEGAARPGHFRGVTTVVSTLFNVFQPHRAYFGQKDAQQVIVIKRMVEDLNFNTEIVIGATQREADGLAMSSRNVKLSPEARQQATCLHHALSQAKTAYEQGERDAHKLRRLMLDVISQASLARVDYVSIAHPTTLAELDTVADQALFSMAVFVDGVRLIDNMIIP
ncbi:MAG: pantoate--beta-alanine ligase [Anaerolineaceae bacterium]|nr:pantoate--beta-alanine ligase [Anaerolineaceae bacterium]MCB9099562.1 pantoate--beta-alanine ligase [Anaerolineales bacterium]